MNKGEKILLGIDFGTGGCKVTAVRASCGETVAEASVEYHTEHARDGWSEQDAGCWYPAMCAALRKLSARGVDLKSTAAVAFDGSTHNAVLLGGDMRPLRKVIMWTDQRSVKECAKLKELFGKKIFETTYQMPTPTWTLPQMMWLKEHEPEVMGKVEHVLFVKDYVRYLVTGVAVTDRIEAQGTLFYDMREKCWSRELAEAGGLKYSALPKIVSPTEIVGSVTASAAKDTGLPQGTPVVCGTSDSAVEDYGAGAIEDGDCIVKLATAGNVNVMTRRAVPNARTLTYSHVIDGMWYTVSATNAAALCQRWFRDNFFPASDGASTYDAMDSLAGKSPIGSGGVMFHPYLQGERSPYWDSNLRASFTGVSISSTRGDFARALLEGVAFSLKDCYTVIEDMGLDVKRIFLIGGGGRSPLWAEIVTNVFGVEVSVPSPGDASYGSALLAGVGIGIFPDAETAVRKCLKTDRFLRPEKEAVQKYEKLFERYKAVQAALSPIYNGKF